MSMHIGNATIAVVQSKHSGMNCDAYPTKLAAVLAMIDNGSLGGDSGGYGSADHKAALVAVEKQIADTRACIAEQDARDANFEDGGE